jgi:hypothetical protein
MGLLGFFSKKNIEISSSMFVGDKGEIQKELSELAIRIGKEYWISLDYSHDSIKKVEKILSNIHAEYTRTEDTKGLEGIALEFACYIAATIQKNSGTGVMQENHPEMGDKTFPFIWNDQTLFLFSWCQKRIYDGPEDNVWSKYQAFVPSPKE